MTQAQLVQLLKSINIPVDSEKADEMEEAIHSAGLKMPRETWCRKEKKNDGQTTTNSGAKYSTGTMKRLPPPDHATKPKAKKPVN